MSSDGKTRRPRAFDADDPTIKVSDPPPGDADFEEDAEPSDHFDREPQSGLGDAKSHVAATPPEERRGFGWFSVFLSAVLALAGLAFSLWYANFVSVALMRDDWLGWTARGLAALIAISLTIMVLREVLGMMRLKRLGRLRADANKAQTTADLRLAQRTVNRLKSQLAERRDARWSLDRFRESERHMRDASALLGLADRVLLDAADKQAQDLIFQSARRVGVVSAVVPIAFIVMLFVTFENLRMVRRLAGAYGGRPGFFGGLRLFSWIIGHVAASGAIALTDDLWGQFFGQDMLRRVSAKLGEGAFNAALTARLGVAALEICRPLPFIEAKPPRARHVFYQVFPDLRPELMKRVWKTD